MKTDVCKKTIRNNTFERIFPRVKNIKYIYIL